MMYRSIWMVVAASLALAGCDMANKEEAQYDDARNPYYKQAQQDLDNNDAVKAALDYQAALGANPSLIEARYQLGQIYADKLNDPVGAIFYFQQYVKLVPNGDKTDEVKSQIDKQSQAFAATLPNAATQGSDDVTKLQAENASLKKQVQDATHAISQLQAQLSKHHHGGPSGPTSIATDTPPPPPVSPPSVTPDTNSPAATPPVAAGEGVASATSTNASAGPAVPLNSSNFLAMATAPPPPEAVASTGPARSYTVVKGDSLWKISHKMYPGDTKNGVEKIQDANPQIKGKPLKIGQVLVVP